MIAAGRPERQQRRGRVKGGDTKTPAATVVLRRDGSRRGGGVGGYGGDNGGAGRGVAVAVTSPSARSAANA